MSDQFTLGSFFGQQPTVVYVESREINRIEEEKETKMRRRTVINVFLKRLVAPVSLSLNSAISVQYFGQSPEGNKKLSIQHHALEKRSTLVTLSIDLLDWFFLVTISKSELHKSKSFNRFNILTFRLPTSPSKEFRLPSRSIGTFDTRHFFHVLARRLTSGEKR